MFQGGGGYDIARLAIPAILSGLLAWLYASLTKVGKAEHQEALKAQEVRWTERCAMLERLIEKQGERNSKFESALNDKVSKAELKEAVNDLKAIVMEMKQELREDFVALRAALNARP